MSSIQLERDLLVELDNDKKGTPGEGFVTVHLNTGFNERPGIIIPELEDVPPSQFRTQLRHGRRYTFYDVNNEGESKRIGWLADLTYRICGFKDDTLVPVRRVMIEVKTGRYSEVERNQQRVMGILNENEDNIVLRAKVHFDTDALVEIQYSSLKEDANTNAGYRFVPFDI